MKYIRKNATPRALTDWINGQPLDEQGRRLNCRYHPDMPGEVKRAIKQQLLSEQGGLCCYTGLRVEDHSSHIEHLKPQSLFYDNHEDVDYANMLAAHPGDDKPSCTFGAKFRGNWYDESLLISPLQPACEHAFRFDQFGDITATAAGSAAAQETIKRLGLDNKSLKQMRRQAIETALFRRTLSANQLKQIIQSYCQPDSERKFRPFCFADPAAAQDVLRKAEKDRQRRIAIHRQEKK